MISGSLDDVVPPVVVKDFYDKAISHWESGDKTYPAPELMHIEGADHFHVSITMSLFRLYHCCF